MSLQFHICLPFHGSSNIVLVQRCIWINSSVWEMLVGKHLNYQKGQTNLFQGNHPFLSDYIIFSENGKNVNNYIYVQWTVYIAFYLLVTRQQQQQKHHRHQHQPLNYYQTSQEMLTPHPRLAWTGLCTATTSGGSAHIGKLSIGQYFDGVYGCKSASNFSDNL